MIYLVASENDSVINSIHRAVNAARIALDERKQYARKMGGYTPFRIYSVEERMTFLKKMSFGEIMRNYNLTVID